jgi:hypothetical protein
MRVRGSTWKNTTKKRGYGESVGSYDFRTKGDRYFVLTVIKTGKTRVYESAEAAKSDGWIVTEIGK